VTLKRGESTTQLSPLGFDERQLSAAAVSLLSLLQDLNVRRESLVKAIDDQRQLGLIVVKLRSDHFESRPLLDQL